MEGLAVIRGKSPVNAMALIYETREALRKSPLVQARGAHSSGLKSVALVAAVAKSTVVFARLPLQSGHRMRGKSAAASVEVQF